MKADTLVDVLQFRARATPDRLALRFGEALYSYGALDRAANQVARAITAQGLQPGARVAIMTKNTPAQIEIWWGAMKARAVLVLINYRLAPREISYIANDANVEMLFVGKDFYDTAAKVVAQLPQIRKVIAIDGGHPEWESLADFRARQRPDALEVAVVPSDVCLQIYTSGTTGQPKGVLTSHQNLIADQLRSESTGLWSEQDRLLLCMPMCHIGGTGVALRSLYFGMEIHLMREFDAAAAIRLIPERRITKAFFVPSMLHLLLQTPGVREADLSTLDLIFYGAGAMPYELMLDVMEVFHCRFGTAFGMTETNGGVTHLSPEDHVGPRAQQLLKSCGRVAHGVEMRIVDESGNTLPSGSVGEIVLRSRQCTSGYYRLPEESARLFLEDGWMRTGDAGYLDEEDYLFISDRLKDMIVSGSLKVFPREVEEVMLEHPEVSDVAVVGVPDPKWREVPKAFVVRQAGSAVTEEALIAFVQERLAKFKVPKSVDFIDALPRNTSGKVLKRELRKPFWETESRQV